MSTGGILAVLQKVRGVFSSRPKNNLAERYPQFKIGRGTYGDLKIRTWNEGASLSVGAFTSIASGVQVYLGGEHRTDWVTTYPFNVLWESATRIEGHPMTKGNVHIGNDVWIGGEAIVLSGVTIGDGAVIGARAVVARDVPPYAVVVGNPAQILRYRFHEATVARLLEIRWWEWPDELIERAMVDMLDDKIDRFIYRAESGYYLTRD